MERNQYFTDTKEFYFIKKMLLHRQKVFREIITVKASHSARSACQPSFYLFFTGFKVVFVFPLNL